MGNDAAKLSKQVKETEERYKKEISEKVKYCRTVVSDKNNLEATVLKLNEEIHAISTEFQTRTKAWDSEKDDLLSQIASSKEKEKEIEERYKKEIDEKDEYCRALVSDKNNLEATVLKLNEEIHAISAELHTGKKAWDLEKDDLLSQIVSSKEKVKELEERYKKEISEKDEYCGAVVSDKNNLEATVFKLNEEIHAISAEFHTGNKAWDLEKEDLLSQIVASKEKQVILERKVTELETNLDYARKDLDYSRASTIEKERNIVELQYKLAETAATNKLLEEKNSSLLSDANKRNIVLEEKNASLQQKIMDQEMSLQSLHENLESKDLQLLDLKPRRKLFPLKSPSPENGKENSAKRRENGNGYGLREKSTLSVVKENLTPNTTDGNARKPAVGKRTPQNQVAVKRTPLQTVPAKTKPIWH